MERECRRQDLSVRNYGLTRGCGDDAYAILETTLINIPGDCRDLSRRNDDFSEKVGVLVGDGQMGSGSPNALRTIEPRGRPDPVKPAVARSAVNSGNRRDLPSGHDHFADRIITVIGNVETGTVAPDPFG